MAIGLLSALIVAAVLLFFGVDLLVQRMYAYESPPPAKTPEKYGIPFEAMRIPAVDSGTLAGWWIPGQAQSPTLILVHGWSRNTQRMLPYIRHLHPLGYNLLAFDARNHGNSSPYPRPTVYSFAEDAVAAARFVRREHPDAARKMGIIGLSVGGGGAINAATLDERLDCVITVGAVGHPVWTMLPEMRKRGIPESIARLLLRVMEARYGLNFERIAPVNNIGKSRARILLIHGEADETISLSQAEALHQAGNPQRVQLWVVPGKGHSNCHTHPEFWERVEAFLQSC
ncbi:MAG: alpha/beta hydrolase [Anaerolineales bacterium]